MTRVVLLGYGAINSRVASLLELRQSPARIVGLIVRNPTLLPQGLDSKITVVSNAAELRTLSPDIVLEAASRDAVRQWGAAALRSARRLVISSASALTDDDFLQELERIAGQCGSQLVLSPGALAGIDALSAGARLGLHEVRHRIIKSPKSWGAALGTVGYPADPMAPLVFFQGTAREAARRYPLNANVTVVSALASLGLDKTIVELISDPSAETNCHELHVVGDFGRMTTKIENRPLKSNPRSSELAALALVRLIENEAPGLSL